MAADEATFTRMLELCHQGRDGFKEGRPEAALDALQAVADLALSALSWLHPPAPDDRPAESRERLRLKLLQAKAANRILAGAYESSLATFHKFRSCLSVVQQAQSYKDFPGLCRHVQEMFGLGAVELVLARELAPDEACCPPALAEGDATPTGCVTVCAETEELSQAWRQLAEAAGASLVRGGHYIGPASALEHPGQFFPAAVAQRGEGDPLFRGSCFLHCLRRGDGPEALGFLSLLDADPERYSPDKATDFLEHFCTIFAATAFSLLDREQVSGRQYLDPLTGIRNRAYLERFGQQLLEQAGILDIPLCLLFVDLDRFKPINDTWGHETGDLVLREVARTLDRVSRRGDVVCRLGGDEFIIMLPDAGEKEAGVFAARLAGELADITPAGLGVAGDFQVSASIGLACRREGMDLEGLLKAADAAMYAVKRRRDED